jgi:glycerophosphoryl diester phosphodiesterase
MLLAFCCALFVLAVILPAARGAEPLIIAHRGASHDAPENTLAAFRLAWQQGADGIEADFRLSADGRVVCIHDADMKRVSGKELVVKQTNYADLKSLDVGAWKGEAWRGESIPTLEDVLAVLPAGKFLFIEIKTGPEIVAPLVDVLKRARTPADQLVIISFDADVVIACKQQLPQVKCHLLVDYKQQENGTWTPTAEEVIARARRAGADGLGTQNRPEHFQQDFVRQLQAAGVDQFHVWTVDDADTAREYRRLGAWALTTNRPAALRAALAER